MIHILIDFCEGLAKLLGISLKIPRPIKSVRRATAATNGIFGFSLIAVGIAISNKILVILGALGLAGAIVVAMETER